MKLITYDDVIITYNDGETVETVADKQLTEQGWKYVSCGCYSRIYGKSNKDYVIKIATKNDSNTYQYYLKCRQRKNIHLPKIHRIFLLSPNIETYVPCIYYICFMEKLELAKYGDNKTKQFHKELTSKIDCHHHDTNVNIKYVPEDDDISYACNTIISVLQSGATADLHGEDYLYRKSTKSFVISDPVF
jgi:hypothetical protein